MSPTPRLGSRAADRYGLVVLVVALSYTITASVGPTVLGTAMVLVTQLVTVWLVFSASESRRAQRISGTLLLSGVTGAVIMVLVSEYALATDGQRTVATLLGIALVPFFAVAPVVILRHIVRRREVDTQTVLGAIAAYLLIGMLFAYLFLAVARAQDGPFFGDAGDGTMSDLLFFSFVTVTTTGYGNLVPVTNPGQTLAVAEAVIGQLFLVTAVAKIVADWRLEPRASG